MSNDVGFKNRDRFVQLGLTIAYLRKLKGMSQEDLAEKANLSRSHISVIEAPGIIRPFSLEVLFNIADALEMEAEEILVASKIPDKIKSNKIKQTVSPVCFIFYLHSNHDFPIAASTERGTASFTAFSIS